MGKIEIGQELEFFEPARLDGRIIEKGTRVRVGHVEKDLLDEHVLVVLLGTRPPETLAMPRHILTMHSVLTRGHG